MAVSSNHLFFFSHALWVWPLCSDPPSVLDLSFPPSDLIGSSSLPFRAPLIQQEDPCFSAHVLVDEHIWWTHVCVTERQRHRERLHTTIYSFLKQEPKILCMDAQCEQVTAEHLIISCENMNRDLWTFKPCNVGEQLSMPTLVFLARPLWIKLCTQVEIGDFSVIFTWKLFWISFLCLFKLKLRD